MPMFEYECARCQHVFEKLVLSHGANKAKCPRCHSSRTEQLFSTFSAGKEGRNQSAASSGCGGPRFT
ncbi:MAG: zinc ribbon domain-containing protein [Acidobacteriia bacterium]|nr:zinc ribbon domain-containing protein [Terriglobia bacterium]